MRSLGTPENPANKPSRGVSLKAGTIGMTIMLVIFLVALVFAANENDVVGWLVVIVSLGWLLVFSFVVFSLRSAAKKASAKFDEAQDSFNLAAGRSPRGPSSGSAAMRDQKLDHSFKIIQVQTKVVRDYQGKDEAVVDRALETIEITAHNARGMMKAPDDDGPVQGTVVNE